MTMVQFKTPASPNNYVTIIKAVRALTGMGLKETKNLCDGSKHDWASFEINPYGNGNNSDADNEIERMRVGGAEVILAGNRYEEYVDSIREIVTVATLAGDYFVARVILEMLEKNFPNA